MIWQKEQEQYQHQLHNELLLLNDTRKHVTQLNEQIRTLVLIQKKARVAQKQIQEDLQEAYKDFKVLKGNLTLDDVERHHDEI